jgi:hypothetical protein
MTSFQWLKKYKIEMLISIDDQCWYIGSHLLEFDPDSDKVINL